MKWQNLLIGAIIGGVAYHFWLKSKRKNEAKNAEATTMVAVQELVSEQSGRFSPALKKEYDIVLPADMVSKKVRKKAKELTKGRYSVSVKDVKSPVTI